ncbi:hypothetical protein Vadar_012566 [Vaccinium darrowii]|uniref:Uncharacterized protein n=1 Tax=Vaccinium darrowii TaxID=229202 RepID=A0ACB7XQI8_9ERIC|nr:hypothetical protein Vadar_012566 [Vaccinium darrowii]
MGKLVKWIKSLFTGKKDKEKKPSKYTITESEIFTKKPSDYVSPAVILEENPVGWGSQRSSICSVPTTRMVDRAEVESWIDQKQALVAAATAKQGAVYWRGGTAVEEAAAVVIQSVFRSYLARKALRALKGLVKVQALVRGYLVRKRTKVTLWCIQSLMTAQDRARAQRIRMADESNFNYRIQSNPRRSVDSRSRHQSYHEINMGMDEPAKILEMDLGQPNRITTRRNSFSSNPQTAQKIGRFSTHSVPNHAYSKQEHRDLRSAPRSQSMRFDDYYFDAAQSSPRYTSQSEHPPYGQTHHQAVQNRAYSKQEHRDSSQQPSTLIGSVPRSRSMRYNDYNFDTDPAEITDSSSRKRDVPRTGKKEKPSVRDGTGGKNYMDPWFAKLARVSAAGRESDSDQSSITSLTNTGKGRSLPRYEKSSTTKSRADPTPALSVGMLLQYESLIFHQILPFSPPLSLAACRPERSLFCSIVAAAFRRSSVFGGFVLGSRIRTVAHRHQVFHARSSRLAGVGDPD